MALYVLNRNYRVIASSEGITCNELPAMLEESIRRVMLSCGADDSPNFERRMRLDNDRWLIIFALHGFGSSFIAAQIENVSKRTRNCVPTVKFGGQSL